MKQMSHFNEQGRAKMVEVSHKQSTYRRAIACGSIRMEEETLALIESGGHKKGDVLAVAQIAAIMGAKRTSDWIPMCHPIFLTGIEVTFEIRNSGIYIEASVSTEGKTGVEMEALTAVTVGALTIYDMCKAVDKEMSIHSIELLFKEGGCSGVYDRGKSNG